MSKERPILFSAPMVLALLAGTKTQTRRLMKPQPAADLAPHVFPDAKTQGWISSLRHAHGATTAHVCPYGQPGDRLWVRETWAPCEAPIRREHFQYAADGAIGMQWWMDGERMWKHAGHTLGVTTGGPHGVWVGKPSRWRPSIHMPRSVSRITLEVTGVRVERLQEISEFDAKAEGLEHYNDDGVTYWGPLYKGHFDPRAAYRSLWESINGPGSWAANPWVWVVEFKKASKP